MTRTTFGEQACHNFRAKLDSYIDGELQAETNLEMIEHFRRCNTCTQEAQERRDTRQRLQKAVRDIPVPAGLEERVRDRVRQPKRPERKKLFLMAIAAALALSFGVFRVRNSSGELLRIALMIISTVLSPIIRRRGWQGSPTNSQKGSGAWRVS
jgi:anti-sigma factor RsiW